MLHQIPYIVIFCGLVGIPFRMLLDLKCAWPTIVRLLQVPRDATTVAHYRVLATPLVEFTVYDPQPIEATLLAA